MTIKIAVMQGRLLPPIGGQIQAFPTEGWRDEFQTASEIGIDTIEFIFDTGSDPIERHPLLDPGCPAVREVIERTGISVQTVCGDYFMFNPLHRGDPQSLDERVGLLARLVENTSVLGITDLVVPCVDQGSLESPEEKHALVERLSTLLPMCSDAGVRLALETDLAPAELRDLLEMFDSSQVTVNYDLGNSISLGYDPVDEWAEYGQHVSSVHIKDRTVGGPTVPLGTGGADFDEFFAAVRDAGYRGTFVLQAARQEGETETITKYLGFLRPYFREYLGADI